MKKYIKELNKDQLIELIGKNEKLYNKLAESFYETQMDMQSEDTENMFGKDYHRWIEYRDNYNSFYFIIKDWRKFIENLDTDYLDDENIKIANYIEKKIDVLDSMEYGCENYWRLDEYLEKKAKEVLDFCEKSLHGYEEYPSIEDVVVDAIDNDLLENYYIELDENGNTDNVIKLDVNYTETFD